MSGRQSFSRGDDEQDSKAIFLSIYNDLDARIKSREELMFALQQTGRNPTGKQMGQHWKESTRYMTYDDFVAVCRRLPVTTQDDLMKAFRKMDANGDGFISRKEFLTAMTSKGEKMTMKEVIDIIERVDENGDGRLDYHEFCNLILSNVEDCKSAAKRKMTRQSDSGGGGRRSDGGGRDKAPPAGRADSFEEEDDDEDVMAAPIRQRSLSPKKGQPPPVIEEDEDDDDDIVIGASQSSLRASARSDSRGGDSRRGGGDRLVFSKTLDAPLEEKEPRNLRRWTKVSRRGSLFLEDCGNNSKAVLTHMYSFSLSKPTHMMVRVSPLECKSLDIPAPDLNLLLVRNGRPVALGEQSSPDGRASLRADLDPGEYRVYPVTSGLKFRARAAQPTSKAKLLKKDRNDKIALTTACKDALSDIFKMVDLDGNGYLNKEEFGHYIMRTSGERLEDNLWEVVEENCNLVRGEISEEDFLKLNLKEVEQDEGDTENLWITLDSMGFNHQLFMDEAFPFHVEFFAEDASARMRIDVTELTIDDKTVIEKALVALVMEKGDIRSLPGAADASFGFLTTRLSALVVGTSKTADVRDIKVRSGVWVDVNCAGSENLLLEGSGLKTDFNLKPSRPEVLFWLVPKDMRSSWRISCELKKRS